MFPLREPIPYATFGIADYKYSPHRITLLKVVNSVWKDYLDGTISDTLSTEDGVFEIMAKPETVSAEFTNRIRAFEDADFIFNDINYLEIKDDLETFVDENNISHSH
jgi:membrane carboxypeptidase/penicillin-binding protein PbpC